MRSPIWEAFAALAFLALAAMAWGDSLLVNGGFETPEVQTGSFTLFNPGDDIGGWTAIGMQVAATNTNFTQSGFAFVSEEGNQWLDLSGFNANSAEGVEQTAATTPGAQYDLRFWVGNIVDPGGAFGLTSTVNVYIDGTLQLTATNSNGAGAAAQTWQEFTLPFTAAGDATAVRFLNGDPANDNSNGLDNVSLTLASVTPPPPTVVPLPSALAQVAVSCLVLAGVTGILRLRRQRAA